MKRVTRRDFVKTSMAAGLAFGAPRLGRAATAGTENAGPNGELRLAVIGMGSFETPGNVGGRGHQLIGFLRETPGVKVVTLCDVDTALLQREAADMSKRGEKVATCRDLRQMLDDKSIDAVVIATPDHWHSLAAVWACQAGKDVYVEKPMSHNLFEGRQLVAAAKKYGRIVQTGMEGRASDGLRQAFEFLHGGEIGPVRYAHVVLYRDRKSIGKTSGTTPIPTTVDYDLWCGPSPRKPLARKYLHYDWHWVWDQGAGEMGNNGVHYLDLCRWGLNLDRLPRRAMSLGGRFAFHDDGETPNTQLALFDFDSLPVTCEIHGLPERHKGGYRTQEKGIIIQCEGGYFAGSFEGGTFYDKQDKKIKTFRGANFQKIQGRMVANFAAAVRSRKPGDLHADASQGHFSAGCCHMANISYRLGKEAAPGSIAAATRGNHELNEAFERCREHLAGNRVDLDSTQGVLGPWVTLDGKTERFVGEFSDQANAFVSRAYRQPFVVPTIA